MAKIRVYTMKQYLGIDAGGTHTRFLIFDDKGVNIDRIDRDSIHFMRVGFDGIKKVLEEVRLEFETRGYDFESMGVAIGTAGYGEDQLVRKGIEDAIWGVFPKAVIMNDAKFAMASALSMNDGVYLISGTGSIAFRKQDCNYDRRGGFGYLLADEGSAFWIGKRILEVFTKEADGRLPRTDLYTAIMHHFELTEAYDLISIANNHQSDYRTWVAQFSKIAENVQSVHADNVYERAGQELADLANNFELNGKTKIAFGGGVLLNNKHVYNAVVKNLSPDFEVVTSDHPVEYAAYLLFQ